MVPSTYRDLFTALAGASGALTGLLFVALSVTSRPGAYSGPPVIHQVRAAAAWLAFTNVLMVSLFGLVPGTNAGYPAAVLGIIGITYTAGAIRSVLTSEATSRQQLRQSGLGVVLLLVFGTELGAGIVLIAHPASASAAHAIGYALVSSLLVGVARSWELVGTRDPGIVASLTALTGRQGLLQDDASDPGQE